MEDRDSEQPLQQATPQPIQPIQPTQPTQPTEPTHPATQEPANQYTDHKENSGITAAPWDRELTATGWEVTAPPASAGSDIRTLVCTVPLGVNARAISALPELIKAARQGLEWVPPFMYREIGEPLVKAGVLERHTPIDLTCTYPGCQVSDGTVVKCDWCPQLVCAEHDDVLLNRDIHSDLTLCHACGEQYDHQATAQALKTLAAQVRTYLDNAPENATVNEGTTDLTAALQAADKLTQD